MPLDDIFLEALISAFSVCPQLTQRNLDWVFLFFLSMCLHIEHSLDVFLGSISNTGIPARVALYLRKFPNSSKAHLPITALTALLTVLLVLIPLRSSMAIALFVSFAVSTTPP